MTEKYKRTESVKTKLLEDGTALLVNQRSEWAFALTPLGALIWELCDGEHSLEDLTNAIRDIPELASRRDLETEIKQFIATCLDDGFLDT